MPPAKKPNLDDVLQTPEGVTGMNMLLQREIIFRIIGSTNREIRAAFSEVEPFKRLDHGRYIGPFDSNANCGGAERRRGDMFVIWPYGKPQLSVVEDPRQRSIVVLKKYTAPDGSPASLTHLLTGEENGLGLTEEQAREYAHRIDGITPGSDEPVEIIMSNEPHPYVKGVKHTQSKYPNSWGTITVRK